MARAAGCAMNRALVSVELILRTETEIMSMKALFDKHAQNVRVADHNIPERKVEYG